MRTRFLVSSVLADCFLTIFVREKPVARQAEHGFEWADKNSSESKQEIHYQSVVVRIKFPWHNEC